MNSTRLVLLLGLVFLPNVLAAPTLPGQSTTPEAAGVPNLLLQTDERSKLVYINNVQTTNVKAFTSKNGKKHLNFDIQIDGQMYNSIMFDGDWKKSDQDLLNKGKVHLLGIWREFADKPSFTALKVMEQPIKSNSKLMGDPKNLMIRDVKVNIATVNQYISKSKKKHITFRFSVNGKDYSAIIFDSDRKENTGDILRSGRATIYGYWAEYKGKPSFVVEKIER